MSERICAKCDRDISLEERPWTLTGCSSDEFGASSGESVFVCEGCYDDLTAETTESGS